MKKKRCRRFLDTTHLHLGLFSKIKNVTIYLKENKLFLYVSSTQEADYGGFDTLKIYSDGHNNEKHKNLIYAIGVKEGKYNLFIIPKECGSIEELNDISSFEIRKRIPDDCQLIVATAAKNIGPILPEEQIFVFGSNMDGYHNGGAAAFACEHYGAKIGVSEGLMEQSYALPSVTGHLYEFKNHIDNFISFAKKHPEREFVLTRVGCGSAFWSDKDIAPLFKKAVNLPNVYFPLEWQKVLKSRPSDIIDEYIYALGDISGPLGEWIGNLAVLYAKYIGAELFLTEDKISVLKGTDDLLDELLQLLNCQHISSRKRRLLIELNNIVQSIAHECYYDYYDSFLKLFVSKLKERSPQLFPDKVIRSFMNALLSEAGCKRIYNPFANLGALVNTFDSEALTYKLHESSHEMHVISKLLYSRYQNVELFEGDCEDDWKGDDCDGLMCILPGDYNISRNSNVRNSVKARAHRYVSYLLNKLSSLNNFKRAVIVLKEDVLYDNLFKVIRQLFIEKRAVSRVIPASDFFYDDAFILCLDFDNHNDYIRLAAPSYWSDLHFQLNHYLEDNPRQTIGYALHDIACERNPFYEMFVPIETVIAHDSILDYCLYNEPRLGPTCFNLHLFYNYYEDEYNYRPLKELVTVLPEYNQYNDWTWKYELKNFVKRELILPDYLLMELDSDFDRMLIRATDYHVDLQRYIGMWPIRLPKEGISMQAEKVQSMSALLSQQKADLTKRYRVITDGIDKYTIAQMTCLELLDVSLKEVDLKYRQYRNCIDAIIVDEKSEFLEKALGLIAYYPVYVLTENIYEADNDIRGELMAGKVYDTFKQTQIFEYSNFSAFENALMRDLEINCSPSTKVRNNHYKVFECAKTVDELLHLNSESFIEEILIEAQTPSELSDNILRKIRLNRDNVINWLKQQNVVPQKISAGAVTEFLALHHYIDKENNEYYQSRRIMPEDLGKGLYYMTDICNKAAHEDGHFNEYSVLAMIDIYLQLISWLPDFITLLNSEDGQKGDYWFDKQKHKFQSTDEGIIKTTSKNGESYYYCGNVHLGNNRKGQSPVVGHSIRINKTREENQPYLTGDGWTFFYSIDWDFE